MERSVRRIMMPLRIIHRRGDNARPRTHNISYVHTAGATGGGVPAVSRERRSSLEGSPVSLDIGYRSVARASPGSPLSLTRAKRAFRASQGERRVHYAPPPSRTTKMCRGAARYARLRSRIRKTRAFLNYQRALPSIKLIICYILR